LREERRLRVFENWVLRRVVGSKRDDVRGEWRKLHNEKLHDLYSSTYEHYTAIITSDAFTLSETAQRLKVSV
jgi:hypothetical protein